jgi:hypothetical protein
MFSQQITSYNLYNGSSVNTINTHNLSFQNAIGSGVYLPVSPLVGVQTFPGVYQVNASSLTLSTTSVTNNLKIKPTCGLLFSDYVNGVSTLDLVLINRHISGVQPFTTGYQKLAADANNSWSITSDDVNMIRSAILGVNTNWVRKPWEWMPKWYVDQSPTGFFNNPYQFSICALYPIDPDGWTPYLLNNKTTAELTAFPNLLTDLRTTKVGDVNNSNTSQTAPGTFQNVSVESRAIENSTSFISKDKLIKIGVELNGSGSLLAYQLPLFIDKDDLEIVSLDLESKENTSHYYRKEDNRLMIMEVSPDGNEPIAKSEGKVGILKLKAKKDIYNLSKSFHIDQPMGAEMINENAEYSYGEIKVIIEDVYDNENYLRMINDGNEQRLIIHSDQERSTTLSVHAIDGKLILQKNLILDLGTNEINLDLGHQGLYIVSVNDENFTSIKVIK